MSNYHTSQISFNQNDVLSAYTQAPSTQLYNKATIKSSAGSIDLTNKEICLFNFFINYSFPSFTQASSFSYQWVDGTTNQVNIPANSTFSASDFDGLLKSVMYANTHYLLDAGQTPYYYMSIQENSVRYALQMNTVNVPPTLPSGYTLPPLASWSLPASNRTPLFIVSAGQFQTLTSFPIGTYPTVYQTTPQSLLGTNPHLCPYPNINILCSAANNVDSFPNNLLASIPIDVSYGQPLKYAPNVPIWIPTSNSVVNQIDMILTDPLGNRLTVLDSYWSGTLIIREKRPDSD